MKGQIASKLLFFHFCSLSAQEMPSSPYGWTSRDIIWRPGLWNRYEQQGHLWKNIKDMM